MGLVSYTVQKLITIILAILLGTLISFIYLRLMEAYGYEMLFIILQVLTYIIIIYLFIIFNRRFLYDELTVENDPQAIFFLLFFFSVQPYMFEKINNYLRGLYAEIIYPR